MNRTKIEYLDFTWSPANGCFGYGCEVRQRGNCWAMWQAKRQKHRCELCYSFVPHVHAERFDQPLKRKKPSLIGVCFSGELFGIYPEMTNYILSIIETASWHTFFVLTKQVYSLKNFRFPDNLWLGVSVNTQNDIYRIGYLRETKAKVKAVSFEPLYEKIVCSLKNIDWIIIGAETRGKKRTFIPKKEWVEILINEAWGNKTAIWMKNNLHPTPFFHTQLTQEYPMKVKS